MSSGAPWQVLVIDDQESWREANRELLAEASTPDGAALSVKTEADFDLGLQRLTDERIDLVILDVRDESPSGDSRVDDEHGRSTFDAIRARQFLPVIFHTGFAEKVEDLAHLPLVQVVAKGGDPNALLAAVDVIFTSKLPQISRALTEHVRDVLRDYLWSYAGNNWEQIAAAEDGDLARQLVNRLALSLTRQTLKFGPSEPVFSGSWHPAQLYILPPILDVVETGAIVFDNSEQSWHVVLTPSCDLAQNKADYVLLAGANELESVDPFGEWLAAKRLAQHEGLRELAKGDQTPEQKAQLSKLSNLEDKCRKMVEGKIPRFFHLPRFMRIPDLIVDLQRTNTVSVDRVNGLEVVATLNPPYTQALTNRYTSYIGRVGLDDPDSKSILGRID